MRTISFARVISMLAIALVAARPANAQRSNAMAQECRGASADSPANRQRAEQWVQERLKAFVPTRDQALRMRSLALQAEQVKLAFYGISTTCAQYLAGTMTSEDADRSLSGFEQTIANFLHDLGNETVVLASRGQVSDMGTLRQSMTDIGATGRQAALMGNDALAEESRKKLVDALVSFSRAFVDEACYSQTFDPRIAMGLARQNEILGTGIDVTPCANRKFTAEGRGGDILWKFRHCGRGVGEWKIESSGPLNGGGTGTIGDDFSGTWSISEVDPEGAVTVQYSGDLSILLKPVADDPDTREPDRLSVLTTGVNATTSEGDHFHKDMHTPGLTFVVKKSDTPCRDNEGS